MSVNHADTEKATSTLPAVGCLEPLPVYAPESPALNSIEFAPGTFRVCAIGR